MKNGQGKKILIVEDERSLVEIMGMKLKKEGYEVFSAQSGKEGVEKAKTEKPDIILLDIIMPGMNGYEVLEILKRGIGTASIPIVIVSNSGRDEEIEKGRSMGAVDYLVKSQLSLDEMAERIGQLLENIGQREDK